MGAGNTVGRQGGSGQTGGIWVPIGRTKGLVKDKSPLGARLGTQRNFTNAMYLIPIKLVSALSDDFGYGVAQLQARETERERARARERETESERDREIERERER